MVARGAHKTAITKHASARAVGKNFMGQDGRGVLNVTDKSEKRARVDNGARGRLQSKACDGLSRVSPLKWRGMKCNPQSFCQGRGIRRARAMQMQRVWRQQQRRLDGTGRMMILLPKCGINKSRMEVTPPSLTSSSSPRSIALSFPIRSS